MDNPVLKEIEKKRVDKSVKLLQNRKSKVTKNVRDELDKLESFGINNSTSQYLRDKINKDDSEIEDIKQHNKESSAVYQMAKMFFPYSVITYATMDELTKKYGFVISDLSYYKAAIPEENVQELQAFKEKFITDVIGISDEDDDYSFVKINKVDQMIKFNQPYLHCFTEHQMKSVEKLDFTTCLKIMAPMGSFNFPKRALRVGNEIAISDKYKNSFNYSKLGFVVPKLKLDPVIFLPYRFLDNIYCIVITAWDKIADDTRIRSLI